MKRNFFKSLVKLTWLAVAVLLAFTSCKKDDDPKPEPILVEDGFYIVGDGIALTELDSKGMMKATRNEALNEETTENRSELMELYIAVKGGTDGFNIVQISGQTKKTYGPGTDFAVVPEAERDIEEPKADFWRGSYIETENKFTVPDDGLYHVVIDTELGIAIVAPVEWGIIGGATPGAWSNSTPLPMKGSFDLNTITFEAAEVTLLESDYKFRYTDGWKIIIDADYDNGINDKGLKVNTNLGGALNALVPGGANITNAAYAVYKVSMTWILGTGTTVAVTYVKDGEPLPEYPEELYMVGSALDTADTDVDGTPDGWQWTLANFQMIPVHSHPELFWKIVWLYEGESFKFAPQRDWIGEFGKTGDSTDGVFAKGGSNVPVPATGSGYYMVVVNLMDETIEVNVPTVYGIGDAFGSYDVKKPEYLFTVDNANMVIKFADVLAATELRMYAAAATMPCDWWQSEFMILEGNIEFRGTGNDQARVAVTAGQDVSLNFKALTGTIE